MEAFVSTSSTRDASASTNHTPTNILKPANARPSSTRPSPSNSTVSHAVGSASSTSTKDAHISATSPNNSIAKTKLNGARPFRESQLPNRTVSAPVTIPHADSASDSVPFRATTTYKFRPAEPSKKTNPKTSRKPPKGTKKGWKKLLWVKQSYPDNYTDTETFLDHLQRNPRFRPYDFWPLVSDFTVVVQHLCSVIIFLCCFTGIFQERIAPIIVVGWGTFATILGWILWDSWVAREQEKAGRAERQLFQHQVNMRIQAAQQQDQKLRFSSSEQEQPNKNYRTPTNQVEGLGLVQIPLQKTSTDTREGPAEKVEGNSNVTVASIDGTVREDEDDSAGSRRPTISAERSSVAKRAPSFSPATSASVSPSEVRSFDGRADVNNREGSRALPLHTSSPPGALRSSKSQNGRNHSSSIAASLSNSTYFFPLFTRSLVSVRNRQRAKSALLLSCFLLGLAPILESLTKSTTSDSIWAMSCWLLIINIFSFDYGSPLPESTLTQADVTKTTTTTTATPLTTTVGDRSAAAAARFPASLSTNAALMASTVFASRLASTTDVFSLTLFSIEVFGLFPIFRRYLRAISFYGHVVLTIVLIEAAGVAVWVTMSRSGLTIGAVLSGMIVSGTGSALAMGICSWWLISLQKYKNVVIGPWDPARPVLRTRWDF